VRLVEYGFVDSYDWGDRARSAAPGYRLLAFATSPLPGELGAADDQAPALSVRVDGKERGPLTATSDYVVTAVPQSAKQIELVLTDSGVKQSISLLTGQPAASNPAVTVRAHDRQSVNVSKPVRVQLQTPAGTGAVDGMLTLTGLSLTYWSADGQHCADPDRAWLHVGAVVKLDGDPQAYGAESGLISVQLPGSADLRSKNAAPDPTTAVDDVVEVPGDLTTGSVTYSGTVKTPKGTLTVLTPVTLPFDIPAG
jgi:hypothetical protein